MVKNQTVCEINHIMIPVNRELNCNSFSLKECLHRIDISVPEAK